MIPANQSQLQALADTAWWTAAARAHESRREDRLFDDPLAGVLVGFKVLEQFDQALAGTGTADLQAVITRFFDEYLLSAVNQDGIRQVVLMAAGLDARAFRLTWPPRTRVFELEQAVVIRHKNQMLSRIGARPRCDWRTVAVNLNEKWMDPLMRAGFEAALPSVWLLEGASYFLNELTVRNILTDITKMTPSGSRLGLDVVNECMLTSARTRPWSDRMMAGGTPWLFTCDDPERLMSEFGWSSKVVQPGEDGAAFGRSPFPITARGTSGEPRSFLVTATRE